MDVDYGGRGYGGVGCSGVDEANDFLIRITFYYRIRIVVKIYNVMYSSTTSLFIILLTHCITYANCSILCKCWAIASLQ